MDAEARRRRARLCPGGAQVSLTVGQAREEILSLFKAAWDAGDESDGVLVLYDNDSRDPPAAQATDLAATPFARVSVRHSDGGQSSLADESGIRRFARSGTIFVQVFTGRGIGLALSDALVATAIGAFEGERTAGGVWFRNVRAQEIGPDGAWHQVNVLAEFEYDELR